jgi:hypothetical protein
VANREYSRFALGHPASYRNTSNIRALHHHRDPNCADHWHSTANVIRTAAEAERKRFFRNLRHQRARTSPEKPAA